MLSKNLLLEIKEKSALLHSFKPLSAENQAKLDKKFRLEFNFNSNHLEGNTLTYGETELLLIFDQTEGTHDYREYQEMQAHDVALRMIQEESAETERPLLENFIRSLNEKILVKPFWKDAITTDGQNTRKQIIPGEYKKTPNSVRLANGEIFAYSDPGDVQKEMAELVAWFNENNGKEDPVLLAALLHYRFVRIHPFDDGNGRTARLLMNYVFAKNNLPLVVIKSAEKKDYLAALNRADAGNLSSFVEYIGNQLLWSLDLSIKAARGEDIDEDDDLDKELELLKQDLKHISNKFDKKKSFEQTSELMDKSIIPLFFALTDKIRKVEELFVEIKSLLIYNTSYTNHQNEIISLDADLINHVYHKNSSGSPFKDDNITGISLEFQCLALKKASKQTDISYSLTVMLQDYHYSIIDNVDKTSLQQIPYGSFFNQKDVNHIVNHVIKNIISIIKEATHLNS